MKNYLIIGGSSGIGLSLSKLLDLQGNSVFATFNEHPMTSEGQVQYKQLNVLDENLDLSFLPEQLDGLVYCPGTINLKPFNRISPKDFEDDFKLQISGAVKTIQAALPKLKKAENPSIVLFSTVAVQQGFNFHTQVGATKGAVEGLTRSLAAELAPKMRVNAIAPSLVDTPLASRLLSSEEKKMANASRHPLKRIGQPDDIAEMAAFLLSNKSSWITGQIMHVDGGISSLK